jgi:hypothetical protein
LIRTIYIIIRGARISLTPNPQSIINGNQGLNNSKFDISKHPEFRGILIQPGLGVSMFYRVFEQGLLSFQYDYSTSKTFGKKTAETLTFQNNRILFGVHYQLY